MAIGRARRWSGLSAARPRHDHDTSTGELFASNLFFAGSAGFGARLLRLTLRGCGALDAVVRYLPSPLDRTVSAMDIKSLEAAHSNEDRPRQICNAFASSRAQHLRL